MLVDQSTYSNIDIAIAIAIAIAIRLKQDGGEKKTAEKKKDLSCLYVSNREE